MWRHRDNARRTLCIVAVRSHHSYLAWKGEEHWTPKTQTYTTSSIQDMVEYPRFNNKAHLKNPSTGLVQHSDSHCILNIVYPLLKRKISFRLDRYLKCHVNLQCVTFSFFFFSSFFLSAACHSDWVWTRFPDLSSMLQDFQLQVETKTAFVDSLRT